MSARRIVIIGNGISGITLARQLRKRGDDHITVISSESDHFYSRPALMYVYMGHMQYQHTKPYEDGFWEKNKIELKRAFVQKVNTTDKILQLDDHSELTYDVLVIASGSHPNLGSWHGNHFEGVQGLVSLQDLERMEENTRGISKAVVVGGGLIGIEMVEMLRSRNIHVTYLVREFKFWNRVIGDVEADLVERHFIADHNVELRTLTELKEIKGNEDGRVRSVLTSRDEEIECDFLGICIGVLPTVAFLEGSGIKTERGVLINEKFETNIRDVYAIGDCAEFEKALPGRMKTEQIWYTGRMQGETLAALLSGENTSYQPGNYFNSAKLFDIEFQVYSRTVNIPEHCTSVVWFDYHRRCSIRVFYQPDSGIFEGISLLGIRYRHEVCDRWLKENRSMDYVMEHLSDANFDPEFYPQHEQKVLDIYNEKTGKKLRLKKRNWQRIFNLIRS